MCKVANVCTDFFSIDKMLPKVLVKFKGISAVPLWLPSTLRSPFSRTAKTRGLQRLEEEEGGGQVGGGEVGGMLESESEIQTECE